MLVVFFFFSKCMCFSDFFLWQTESMVNVESMTVTVPRAQGGEAHVVLSNVVLIGSTLCWLLSQWLWLSPGWVAHVDLLSFVLIGSSFLAVMVSGLSVWPFYTTGWWDQVDTFPWASTHIWKVGSDNLCDEKDFGKTTVQSRVSGVKGIGSNQMGCIQVQESALKIWNEYKISKQERSFLHVESSAHGIRSTKIMRVHSLQWHALYIG